MSDKPPPLPPNQPSGPPADDNAGVADPRYNLIADKVGLVPNFRKKDNLYQGICVAVFLVIGIIAGWLWDGWPVGVLVGALAGLVVGALISGAVLMVLGLMRKP